MSAAGTPHGEWIALGRGSSATTDQAWTPWHFVGAVGAPAWFALASMQLLSYVLVTMTTEPGFMPVPLWLRLEQHALLTLLVIGAYRAALALRWAPGRRLQAAFWHVVLALVVSLAHRPLLLAVSLPFLDSQVADTPDLPPDGVLVEWITASILRDWGLVLWVTTTISTLLCYVGGLGLMLGVRLALERRAERLRAERLQMAWDRSRLQVLRIQLNPHFLFNTLNTIVGLIEVDPPRARDVVVQMGDLFRRTLASGEQDWCTLAEELAFAHDYLAIQKARFDERLSFAIESDAAFNWIKVPMMLLQPLVENAIVHGFDDDRDRLTIWVRVTGAGSAAQGLVIEIGNRTTGRLPAGGSDAGFGLANTRDRLGASYGEASSLEAGTVDASTFVARVRIPRSWPTEDAARERRP